MRVIIRCGRYELVDVWAIQVLTKSEDSKYGSNAFLTRSVLVELVSVDVTPWSDSPDENRGENQRELSATSSVNVEAGE